MFYRFFYLSIVMALLVVTACAPQVPVTPQATSAPVATATQAIPAPGAETESWSEGPLPNGTWTVELSVEDFVAMGVPQSDAAGWAGVGTFTFQDGKAVYQFQGETDYECEGTYEVVEDFVRITYTDQNVCNGVVEDLLWRLDDDGLHFQLIAAQNIAFDVDKAVYEAKPWQKVE